ncbi:MAG: SDR family NAD(P)-dependent oxidoreductase [Clostridiales bacterium]|nr:SDR family NAD(P)-dependent oxidoreductase [Clostridiales bacterium]
MRIEKRLIVITGASSGLGLGLRNIFESKGDVVVDISKDGKEYQCDVSDHKKLKSIFDDIGKTYGEIDMLITCAGYGISGAIELLDEEATQKQVDVNFFGTANACKYAIPLMKKDGKMILIASATALFALPFKAYYCASKAAVDSFAQCLRMELSKTNIQVTSICPGDVKTNFSNNREKHYDTNERYGNSIELSTKPTEKTEKRRMSPEYAVKKLYDICEKKHLKTRYIIGRQYKFFNFCRKAFSLDILNKVLLKIFYKK